MCAIQQGDCRRVKMCQEHDMEQAKSRTHQPVDGEKGTYRALVPTGCSASPRWGKIQFEVVLTSSARRLIRQPSRVASHYLQTF